jgi:hypothetical protein
VRKKGAWDWREKRTACCCLTSSSIMHSSCYRHVVSCRGTTSVIVRTTSNICLPNGLTGCGLATSTASIRYSVPTLLLFVAKTLFVRHVVNGPCCLSGTQIRIPGTTTHAQMEEAARQVQRRRCSLARVTGQQLASASCSCPPEDGPPPPPSQLE